MKERTAFILTTAPRSHQSHFVTHRVHWNRPATATAKSLQSCLTLCDPIDGSPPGSAILGILQARIVEWVAISFSNGTDLLPHNCVYF